MNNFFHYSYPNGIQFVSTGNPILVISRLNELNNGKSPHPKIIGVWRYKSELKSKQKN